jgi:hypothetical protein
MTDAAAAAAADPTIGVDSTSSSCQDDMDFMVSHQSETSGFLQTHWLVLVVIAVLAVNVAVLAGWWIRRQQTATAAAAAAQADAKKKVTGNGALLDKSNSVGVADLAYLVKMLQPDSTPMDLLLTVCSTPENLEWSVQALDKVQQLKDERLKQKKLEKPKEIKETAFEIDDAGWDDDDDEDVDEQAKEARLKAKQAEAEKQAELVRLKQATGQAVQLLEGVDDGVLGQLWVEKTLTKAGAWPPSDLKMLKDATFEHQGKQVSALDHPGLRRNLCMTVGRINSLMLNTHSELLEAGAKKLIDTCYFRSSMEFRQRLGILLEAALRVSMTLRSHRLACTIIETVALFKIGCPENSTAWFESMMQRQYDCLPRIIVQTHTIVAPGENEIATGDMCELSLELERGHAENFLRQKLAVCQKQGIPPEVALQSYREAWWILLRVERLDGKAEVQPLNKENGILKTLDEEDVAKFEKEDAAHRLVVAWPLVVQQVCIIFQVTLYLQYSMNEILAELPLTRSSFLPLFSFRLPKRRARLPFK